MDIKMVMHSTVPWENKLETLMDVFDSHSLWCPDRWDITERTRHAFNVKNFSDMLSIWKERKGIFFKRKYPKYWISLEWWSNAKLPGRFSMGLDEKFFHETSQTNSFLDFAKDIFIWGNMLYGFICHQNDYEKKNILRKPTMINEKLVTVGGVNPLESLSGIYWGNFFGKDYVQWFGTKKIESTPCYGLEKIGTNGLLVISSESPLDYENPTTIQKEKSILDYLDKDTFFNIENPTKKCITPFTFQTG